MKMICCALFTVASTLLASQAVRAAEPTKATTDELPLALRALNPQTANILTSAQAQEIRGQGGKAWGHQKQAARNSWQLVDVDANTRTVLANYLGVQSFGGNVYIKGKNIRIGSHNHHFKIK